MRRLSLWILLVVATVAAALGQTTLPFTIRTTQGTNVEIIGDGGTLNLPSEGIGLPVDGTIALTFNRTGGATAVINSINLTGSTEFALSGLPTFPATVTTRTPEVLVGVRYTPGSSRQATARIAVSYTENNRTASFSINLTGTASELAYTYQVLPNGNSTLIASGGTIQFTQTNVDTTATAQVVITNKGSGQGTVNAITYSGSPQFVLAALPFPPATVDAGKDLRFSIQFTPKQLDPVTGSVRIDLTAGRGVSFNIQGSGLGPLFTYDLPERNNAAVVPGQVIAFPDATIGGDKTTLLVRFRNSGNADARIETISIAGAAFSLVDTPFLPLTLTPGSAATVRAQFTPTQPGKATGRLRIGNDNFDVEANALGSNLTYSFSAGGAAVPVQNNGTVVFAPTAVGQTSNVQFFVKNEGTAPASINSISLTATGTTFTLGEVPALPAAMAPGATVPFTITFTPAATGNLTGTLRIDTQSFTLSGAANPPAPVSDYSFVGASGTVQPRQQIAVGLSLAKSYPLELRGTLNLALNSEVFANDPAVQFATGGRAVNFTVAPGSTEAVFVNSSNRIGIQTGTVAGTISLTPSFVTTGGIDLTPQNPTALNLTLPQSAPQLLSVALANKTVSGITLQITGYATSRSVTQMEFQFTPVSGESVATTRLTLNVDSSFVAWYQSLQSQAFGSLFTAIVPFTLQGDVKDVITVADTIQSVSVTLSNRQGASASQSVALR